MASTTAYNFVEKDIIEARFEFDFDTECEGFEGFVSDYFNTPDEPFTRIGGKRVQPKGESVMCHAWLTSEKLDRFDDVIAVCEGLRSRKL